MDYYFSIFLTEDGATQPMHSPRRLRQKLARMVRGGARERQGEGVWMAKKRYARVGAASFPAGDLELVIKYKEPCFASSHPESARPLLPLLLLLLFLLLHLLLPPISPISLFTSSCVPFRRARNTERGLYLIRDFIRFTSSRGLRVVELRANDRLSARLAESMNSDAARCKNKRPASRRAY